MAEPTPTSALVTGATRGIGLGIAQMLARGGAGLTITARDQQRLQSVAAELRDLGAADVVVVPGDLADPGLPDALREAHEQAFADLGALVLNAGVGTAAPIGDLPETRFDKTVAVNLRAPVVLLQRMLPLLRTGGGGRVVVISSLTGVYAEPGLAAYGATKAALISLVETLNAEESGNGVSATALAPGYVDTDMSAWTHDLVPPEQMIPVSDLVTMVEALVSLSPRSVIPRIVVTRAGTSGYQA